MKKIIITIPMEEKNRKEIEKIALGYEILYVGKESIETKDLENAEIILGNLSPNMLKNCRELKWLHLNSSGANDYTKEGVLKEGTLLTNSTGAYGLAIAEHMLAMVLALKKKLNLYNENQKRHLWHDEGEVTSIFGSKTLVVGMGDIGGEFAKRMYLLGSKVYGIKKNKIDKPEYIEEIYQMSELESVLSKFDIVALSLPETKETINLFNIEKFKKMKKGAILLNVGRGSAINTQDLCVALNEGIIGGACLDVVDIEPLPENSPLWDAKNLILTPHVAGDFHLDRTLERIREITIENLKRYFKEETLINIVDFQTGYRKFIK